jgi:non-homologous end joining protein Ku
MRAFWSGEIAFGLVTIPAKLYTATKDLTPQFHQLHRECGTRVNLVRRCPKCNRDLRWDEIGKGYEVSKGEYALFSKEELAKLDGDDDKGTIFSLDMMRFAEELLPADELAPAEGKAVTDREKQLALHLIDELSGPFDPAKHPDEYRSAVLAAVDEKVEAGEVARDATAGEEAAPAAGATTGAQVIDLAELLSRSIKGAAKPGPAKAKSDDGEKAPAHEKPEKAKGKRRGATG